MSKSMWIPTEGDNLPVKLPKSDAISVDAFFWVRGRELPEMGYYDFVLELWIDPSTHAHFSPLQVEYFAYIDNPYK